jgi:RNA polymerase sigma-70 factor (ECF subfamily)
VAAGRLADLGASAAPRPPDLRAPPALVLRDPEGVFRQHAPRIYGLARRMLGNEADAEDVVQEVLLQVVRRLDTFRGESELTTWLHRVTVNCALACRRKNAPRLARQVKAPVEALLDQGDAPAAQAQDRPDRRAADRETRRLIEAAIARLPKMYRDPFVLSGVEGLSNAEVGAALGLSVGAVKSRLHRARLLLRDALAPHFREGRAV